MIFLLSMIFYVINLEPFKLIKSSICIIFFAGF